MKADLAVIGGVGFKLEGDLEYVETPFGEVRAAFGTVGKRRVAFFSRHGDGHLPPHRIDYRAVIWAVKEAGAQRIVAVNTVGTMSYHPVGSLFLPDDFVEFTRSRRNTFYDERAVHVDMSQPYCPELRRALKDAVTSRGLEAYEGVYVCAEGPHLESPAQISMMRQFGDVVGMTGYPEVVLAREQALCYASLCLVTNPACGMKAEPLTLSEVVDEMGRRGEEVNAVVSAALDEVSEERHCPCKDALLQSGL